MAHHARLLLAILCGCLLSFVVSGQPAPKKTPAAVPASSTPPPKTEEDPVAAQRRIVAMSLLTTLADDARSFKDETLRARVAARAADALWETDPEKARALFRRAWEAADAADNESSRRQNEEIQRQLKTGGAAVFEGRPDLRSEVLRLAAKRERALGEEFLKKLQEDADREKNEKSDASRRGPLDSRGSASEAQRLDLATQLLRDGDVERAMEFAGPVLDHVTQSAIYFLSALREKNAQGADALFGSMLARAERDPSSDANTVSGLSSYALTPFLYVTFGPRGGMSMSQSREATPPPDLPKPLLTAFFRAGANILMRPFPPPDQDTTTSGRTGAYMVIKRLLPLFDQYAPNRSAELRAQLTALSPDVPPRMQSGDNRALTRGFASDEAISDPMQKLQDRLDHALSSAERDMIYADVAASVAGKGDLRSRDLADKIEDSDLRSQVRAYVDFELLGYALQKKDTVEASRMARSGQLSHIQRVWAYTQVASLLMPSDRAGAFELLDAAATEARRIDGSDPDRVRGLVAAATGFAKIDRARAWEILSEAVKAANSSEGFTGEDGQIVASLRTKQMAMITNPGARDFDLLEVFRSLAKDDLDRSVQLAKSFTGEAPRANATIAIARGVLGGKESPANDNVDNDRP